MLKTIVKRSGEREDFQSNKTNGWMVRMGHGLTDRMDWSSVVIEARETAPEEMTSQEWQIHLINYLKVRGSRKDGWPYMLMAGRLYAIYLMKKIHGDKYPHLRNFVRSLEAKGVQRNMGYTDDELDYLNDHVIDHEFNLDMSWTQVEQYNLRYTLKDFVTKETFETPQFTHMRMAMAVYEKFPVNDRMKNVAELYNALRDDIINPPSPNYSALGTKHYGMASCCLIAAKDSAQSILVAGVIAYCMTLASGGIGLMLDVRGPGDPVDGGRVEHGGRLNYIAKLIGDTRANKQGPRGGAITMYDTCYSPEIELNIMMQNVRTPVELRERRMNVAYTTNPFFTRKAARKEQYFTFTSFSAPDLHQAFFEADQTRFEELYAKYEADPNFKKNYRDAWKTMAWIGGQEIEQSTLFWANPSEMSRHSTFKGPVRQSNLCVAPETEILTDQGYFQIASLENQAVRVWNGFEFSDTTVVRTSEDSELLKVTFSNGMALECTPYHKFYIQTGFSGSKIKEVRANELQPGMAIIKSELPIIQGHRHLDKAYINGFFTGDGCDTKQGQRVYLYGKKRKLRNLFSGYRGSWVVQENQDREYGHWDDLKPKFFVPMADYTIESRLDWLAGIIDSDGHIARNGNNQSAQIASTDAVFLRDTLLMLQTLGVNAKITKAISAGEQLLPNGRGGRSLYQCRQTERLLINSTDLRQLTDMGLMLSNHEVLDHTPQRSASQFIRVESVADEGRRSATFCFTEPKRHMGMFNGILTGQCMEVAVRTEPWEDLKDLYDPAGMPEKGETGICNIGSIPQHRFPFNPSNPKLGYERYKQGVRAMMEIIDYAIDNSEYHFPAIDTQAKSRRNASVGMSGVATLFAKLNLKHNSPEGLRVWHMLCERHAFACTEVALEMGIERGNAPWMNGPRNDGVDGTRWPDGWTFLDSYKRTIDKYVDSTTYFDWEGISKRIVENKGVRFSTLVAHMPGEQATRKGTGSNSVLLLQALSVDLSDGTGAMPWAALDNDLIGDQYQLAWDLTHKEHCIRYGIAQKWCDQAISADFYEDHTNGVKITDRRMVQQHVDKVEAGLKTSYYLRSLTDQGGAQKDINIDELEPTTKDADDVMARIAEQARAMMSMEGASCTLDGSCGT